MANTVTTHINSLLLRIYVNLYITYQVFIISLLINFNILYLFLSNICSREDEFPRIAKNLQ